MQDLMVSMGLFYSKYREFTFIVIPIRTSVYFVDCIQDIASSNGVSVSTSGVIGSSQKTSPVLATSQPVVRTKE